MFISGHEGPEFLLQNLETVTAFRTLLHDQQKPRGGSKDELTRMSTSEPNLAPEEHCELNDYPTIGQDRASSPYSQRSKFIRPFRNKASRKSCPDAVLDSRCSENPCGRWWAELCAYSAALLALAAIAITLGTHNRRLLPDWPFGISVNALVSVCKYSSDTIQ